MLPERLSNGLCSLRPHEEKLCFSAIFELNEEAEVQQEWFGRTVIYSDRRFTYQEAQEVIETGEGDMSVEILQLNSLAQKLRSERFRNGSINFEREEAKFELDENGKPLRVYFKEIKESNQLIEEFMLLANRKVAEFVGKKRKGVQNSERTFVYRVHDKPNTDKMAQFRSFIVRFGYHMKAQSNKAVAKEINKLMRAIHGKKEEPHFDVGDPFDGQGDLFDRQHRALRAGIRLLYALYLADPSLSGHDGAPLAGALSGRRKVGGQGLLRTVV